MNALFASGKGRAPAHVTRIERRGENSRIHIVTTSGSEALLSGSSGAEYSSHMSRLLLDAVAFSVGGMSPGPADDVQFWLEEQGYPVAYLQIAWQCPDEWVVKEVLPGVSEWAEASLSALLANYSLHRTGTACR